MKNINKKIELIKKDPSYKKISEEMDVLVRVAVEVNEARNLNGWTQEKLAKEVETTQKIVSKVESANINIGLDLFQRFARALNLKLQFGRALLVEGRGSIADIWDGNYKENVITEVKKKDFGDKLSRNFIDVGVSAVHKRLKNETTIITG